ncbi:hypothetical protein HPP92_019864 [Vanilla planifolia]|uniref:Uncharacterized protein n=1 Tax=Vanilla planifolia TaxID=51239 RepID=A0A835UM63_VANPL|nr:hypothetical protein HPP92_020303 [Vanilla planifolia]KAG0465700.1 hypothetical protein HPP92_019864 [Vanilla planifolia]
MSHKCVMQFLNEKCNVYLKQSNPNGFFCTSCRRRDEAFPRLFSYASTPLDLFCFDERIGVRQLPTAFAPESCQQLCASACRCTAQNTPPQRHPTTTKAIPTFFLQTVHRGFVFGSAASVEDGGSSAVSEGGRSATVEGLLWRALS